MSICIIAKKSEESITKLPVDDVDRGLSFEDQTKISQYGIDYTAVIDACPITAGNVRRDIDAGRGP